MESTFLAELLLLFAAVVVLTYLCHRLRLAPIVGFLLAGIAIGPQALSLVRDSELIQSTAEIGVVLLLFTVGVEFSLERLARIARFVIVAGGLQVLLTVLFTGVILSLFGVGWGAGLYTGCLVALSSTAIVLKLLFDRRELHTPHGQIATGILVFQDLSIVVMVLLIPAFAGGRPAGTVVVAVAQALVLIGVVLLLARRAVPWVLERVASTHSAELFLLTIVVICFGIAWLASIAGVSLALGAFLAGLVVSESRFREQALGEIVPLRNIFYATFFVSVGMLLDVRFLIERPVAVLAATAAVLVLKTVLTTASVLVLRYPLHVAVGVALGLAQIGEFSFVLDQAGRRVGLTPAALGASGEQAFLVVAVVLMIATPFLIRAGEWGKARLAAATPPQLGDLLRGETLAEPPVLLEDHVIVGGYGLTGRYLAGALRESGIPCLVVDLNPVSALDAQAAGFDAMFGDLTRRQLLEAAGIERARLLVVAVNDPRAVVRVVKLARQLNPRLWVIARTPYTVDVDDLEAAGANAVVSEELEAASEIVATVLRAYHVPAAVVSSYVKALHAGEF